MNTTTRAYHSFNPHAHHSSSRIDAFRALQELEEKLPLRVCFAELYPSAMDPKKPTIHMTIVPSLGSTDHLQEAAETLRNMANLSNFGLPVISVMNSYTAYEGAIRSLLLSTIAVRSCPLLVSPAASPNRLCQYASTFWGTSIPDDVRQSLGLRLLQAVRQGDKLVRSFRYHPSTSYSHIRRSQIVDHLRDSAIALHNGHAAISGSHWGPWSYPVDLASTLQMLELSGVSVTESDRHFLLVALSDTFPKAEAEGADCRSPGKVAERLNRVRARIYQQVQEIAGRSFETQDLDDEPERRFLSAAFERFGSSQLSLSLIDPESIAQSALDRLDGRVYEYKRVSDGQMKPTISGTNNNEPEHPMFSF